MFELPDIVLDKLVESGIALEHVEALSDSVHNSVRASAQLVGSVAPTLPAKDTAA